MTPPPTKMQPGYELAQVMITVKTYPTPSDRYGETVCVAGVRLDRPTLEWVRLYPMKFRLVDYEQQFKKYEIVEIPVKPQGAADPRPESMRPDQSFLRPVRQVESKKNWAERRQLMGDLVGATTTCDLIAANKAVTYADPAPSLGLVKVLDAEVDVRHGDRGTTASKRRWWRPPHRTCSTRRGSKNSSLRLTRSG